MENIRGIQTYAFEPVYPEDEGVSDSEDSDQGGYSDSERVGKTDWCECEVCVSLSKMECICSHKWHILEEKLGVEDVDCVKQHMDFDVTCLNPSVLAISMLHQCDSTVLEVEPQLCSIINSTLQVCYGVPGL